MFNELDRLSECAALQALLTHYAKLDRQVWHPRTPQLAELDRKELSKLHGELIAYGWLELNLDEPQGCYRITPAGLRAWREPICGLN